MTASPAPQQKAPKHAISPTRAENYAEWYQKVIRGADMAEFSGVRGCMVIKPWGYGIWELIQGALDKRFKDTGHENAYFPLFIPLSYIQKEAAHVEGFAKEMAVVTHHRLTMKDGVLTPDAPLEEPLVVRPTSETVIGEAFAGWVQSYRDLPILVNQWANVVRWELRPRIFLRTVEFLWQEGHTAHADEAEARAETEQMLRVYEDVAQNVLALPVVVGEKPPHERFPGAVNTYCIEAMMQDGRALQSGTSHYLGQNFSKASEIKFQSKAGEIEYAYTTSWGVSTRLIGAIIMAHADDDGLRLPPAIAPQQIVIVPILREGADHDAVLGYAEKVLASLKAQSFNSLPVRAKIDKRDMAAQEKRWEWIRKGVPLILEIGPRDVEGGQVAVVRRDQMTAKKRFVGADEFSSQLGAELAEIQQALFAEAKTLRDTRTVTDVTSFAELEKYFGKSGGGDNGFTGGQGFVRGKWCGCETSLAMLDPLGVTVRCIPFDQDGKTGTCVLTGKPATQDVIFARAY
ncbi:MAG: proline--tRNA ligase [Alphaproteobacteria bacterium]